MDRADLFRRAASGDAAAFEELVRRHYGRLAMWVSLRMGPLLRARVSEDDVVQETLLHAFRSVGGFADGGDGSFRRWLFTLAENRLKDLHRYHAAQRRHPAREALRPKDNERDMLARLTAGLTTPSSRARRKETADQLVASIESLPEPERSVVLMRSFEELTFKEIADRMGKSEATAAAVYAQALVRLKRTMRRR